jgi:hypothetical protein
MVWCREHAVSVVVVVVVVVKSVRLFYVVSKVVAVVVDAIICSTYVLLFVQYNITFLYDDI